MPSRIRHSSAPPALLRSIPASLRLGVTPGPPTVTLGPHLGRPAVEVGLFSGVRTRRHHRSLAVVAVEGLATVAAQKAMTLPLAIADHWLFWPQHQQERDRVGGEVAVDSALRRIHSSYTVLLE